MSYLLFSGLNGMKAGMDGDKKLRRNYTVNLLSIDAIHV
jgi:hypothetical protein